jgi:radical SAM-linked protein
MKNNEVKFTLPMLEVPRTVRIKFQKVGNLQYISHLDLQRSFNRVLVRAGLPLWYTKGFNPHIKMVFGMPLPVGSESECELLDVRVEREMSCEEIRDRLNAELTDELRVLEVYPAERKFGEIAFAEYDYEIVTAGGDEALAARIGEALQNGPLTVLRRTKSTESEVDIRAFLRRFAVSFADGAIRIRAVLSAGEGNYLNPELLITALRTHAGILSGNPTEERYRILRRRALLADGETAFR